MIFVSSSIIKRDTIGDCLEELIGVGIRNIELSGGTKYCRGVTELLRKFKKRHRINLRIHNYFPIPEKDFVLNIASSDREIRKKSVDLIKTSIALACELEIDLYTVHAGYAKDLNPDPVSDHFIVKGSDGVGAEEAVQIMYETISEIGAYGKARGVKVGVENLFPIGSAPNCSLLCRPSEILQFLEDTSEDGNIGLLLDLGHLCICSEFFGFDKEAFISTLRKKHQNRIVGIHLSENDGKRDQHWPLDRDSWQLKIAKLFDQRTTSVTVECRSLEANEARKQFDMVESVLEGKA